MCREGKLGTVFVVSPLLNSGSHWHKSHGGQSINGFKKKFIKLSSTRVHLTLRFNSHLWLEVLNYTFLEIITLYRPCFLYFSPRILFWWLSEGDHWDRIVSCSCAPMIVLTNLRTLGATASVHKFIYSQIREVCKWDLHILFFCLYSLPLLWSCY